MAEKSSVSVKATQKRKDSAKIKVPDHSGEERRSGFMGGLKIRFGMAHPTGKRRRATKGKSRSRKSK